MRRPAAYYLLLLYCTVLMRCAIPVACDALSHLFNEEAHIATVHAVYGSNHLQKEIAAGAESDNTKNQATIHYEDLISLHLFSDAFYFTAFCYPDSEPPCHFLMIDPEAVFFTKDIPPPKVS